MFAGRPRALVKSAVARTQAVESSMERRRWGLCGLQPYELHFARTAGPVEPLPLYFVDNVISTGNTIRAVRAVLGLGNGLAYGNASSLFNHRLRQVAESEPAAALIH